MSTSEFEALSLFIDNNNEVLDREFLVENIRGITWQTYDRSVDVLVSRLRNKLGEKANAVLDLASSEPVNINIFPNLHILGNHVQVSQPLSLTETDTTWWGTAVVDYEDELQDCEEEVNALRMRTQESFPNFGELDDLMNFEQIQVGLAGKEDEWVYMHRGLGVPGRVKRDEDGYLIGPSTDEVFLRETMKEYKRLMTATPKLHIERDVKAELV